MNQFLYYRIDDSSRRIPALHKDTTFQLQLWQPSTFEFVPEGLPKIPFAAYWGFHYFRVFKSCNYRFCTIYDNSRLIHYSATFPAFFRFPFMNREDVQIGSIYTDPDYRGQGLAQLGVTHLLHNLSEVQRRIWYVVEATNKTSIRLAERVGFQLVGTGEKSRRTNYSLLSTYQITNPISAITKPLRQAA